MTGLWIAVAAVLVALAFGTFRAMSDGRFRGTHAVRGLDTPLPTGSSSSPDDEESLDLADRQSASSDSPVDGRAAVDGSVAGRVASASEGIETTWSQIGEAIGTATPGSRATLVQFSSAFCAPCRVTRRVLSELADVVPGVVHVEIDAEHHLDVVRRLGILRTPTTLVLDAEGHEIARAAGAPRKDQVLSALPNSGLTI